MTAAWLLAAASSGNALAQHVVGGMGEPVRMGAFDARGQFEGQAILAAPVSGKEKARAPSVALVSGYAFARFRYASSSCS